MAEGRSIVHMDMDSFFVSVERLHDRSLIGKPLAIGGTGDRGVVASCSYEARAFGVHAAMSMRMASQLCPQLVSVRGDFDKYAKKSEEITQIISEQVPLFEKSSIDEFYIDYSGMDKFFGSMKMAQELRQRIIKESGLPISMGLSANKTVSKIATGLAKPNNERYVPYGTEKTFLAPLPVDKIPMIGPKTADTLYVMGVRIIHTMQNLQPDLMKSAFGKNGLMMWERANGIDDSPVVPYTERKSLSTEETFEQDTIDIKLLESVLVAMTEQLTSKLRRENLLTSCISVKIKYADFSTHSQQRSIGFSSADHTIISVVKDLFRKLHNRRLLIRLIGVRFSSLTHGNYQINLFEDTVEQIRLYQAMDKLNGKYGDKTICRAISMHIPRKNFNPFNGISA